MTEQRDLRAPQATPQRSDSPQRFGPYELIRRIGAGGMAEVFLARSTGAEGLEKLLVVKRILPAFAQRQRFVSMFIDEAKLAVSLNHPNIVQVYEFGKVQDDYYLAMEYIEGLDLSRLLSRLRTQNHHLALGAAIYITLELCKGLDYAHRKADQFGQPLGLVHRDISPHNILISADGVVKIVDFGIARARTVGDEPDSVIRGKFNYMSPEQAIGGHLDQRSDLFSAGIVLYELLYSEPLFHFSGRDDALALIKRPILPDLSQRKPPLPGPVEAILLKALDRVPDRRYESARAMQLDLTRVLFSLPDIHDAQTLAQFLRESLPPRAPDGADLTSAALTPVQEEVTPPAPQTRALALSDANAALTPSPLAATPSPSLDTTQHTTTTSEHAPHLNLPRREKKAVVCLCGDISGFETLRERARPEHLQSHIRELKRIIDSIAFKNRAIVERSSESGFLLLLGLPVSGEDDTERAVWMSLDLIDAIDGININTESPLRLSVGVALGCVLITHSGDQRDVDRQLLGSLATLARNIAREAMPREVVVVGRVYQRVRKVFNFEAIQRLQHASDARYGKGDPSVYRLRSPKTGDERLQELRGSYAVLHGRELELRSLRDHFRHVQINRHAHGVLIEGDMGLGKSALIEEFLRGLESMADDFMSVVVSDEDEDPAFTTGDAPHLLRVQALSHRADTPFALLSDLLQEALGLLTLDDLRAVKAKIDETILLYFPRVDPQEQRYLAHAFGFLFNIKYSDSALEALDGTLRRSRLFLSMRRLLDRMADARPLVILLDDAHLADASSLDFFLSLLDTPLQQPLLLLFAARPPGDGSSPQLLRLRALATHPQPALSLESLRPLSSDDSEALLLEKVRPLQIDPDALHHITSWAGGNPYFLLELLDALRHRGELEPVDGSLTLSTLSTEPWLPSGIEAVIAARIDRLDPNLKLALQQCSILGEEFERADAASLFGEDFPSVLPALCDAQLLTPCRRPSPTEEPTAYRFMNAVTYGVTFRDVLWEDRKPWHALIADGLTARLTAAQHDPSVPPVSLVTLARHLEGADRPLDAATFYLRDAHRASDTGSHPEALRLLNHALRLAPDDPDLSWGALLLKDATLSTLRRHDARAPIFSALDLLASQTASVHPERPLTASLQRVRYLFDIDQVDDALRALSPALDAALPFPSVRAQALRLKAEITGRAGDAEAAIRFAQEALSALQALGQPIDQARLLKILGDLYWQVVRFDQSISAFEQAIAIPDLPSSLENVLHANQGVSLVSSGLYELGCDRFEQALATCRAVGFRQREAGILPNLGYAQHLMGLSSQAISTLRRAIRVASESHNTLAHADALHCLALVELSLDDLQPASRHAERALLLATKLHSNYLLIHGHVARAEVALALASLTSEADPARDTLCANAIDAAQTTLDLGQQSSIGHGLVHGHHLLCRAHLLRSHDDLALSHALQTLHHLNRHPIPDREPLFLHLSHTLQSLQPDALHHAEACLESAASIVRRVARHLSPPNRRAYLNRPPIHAILSAVPGLSSLLLKA